MTYYLVLRGPLGSGKSTVARALATRLSAEVIHVDEVLEEETWDGGSEALFLRANRRLVERARPALSRGVPVIIEGNFYWASVIDDLERRLPYPHEVVRLDVPLDLCIERDRARPAPYGETAAREVFEKVARVDRGVPVDGSGTLFETVGAIERRVPPPAGRGLPSTER